MGGPKQVKQDEWKSASWQAEVHVLRKMLLDCGLTEEIKWRKLCYSNEGKNIAIIQEMKSFLALMFFKGALLKDAEGCLKKPGENSNSGRRFEFASVAEIHELEDTLRAYVYEATEIARAGVKIGKPKKLILPTELLSRFESEPALKTAFEALTPGRQRGYIIYFTGPKGAEARVRRIEKYSQKILAGKGFHDR